MEFERAYVSLNTLSTHMIDPRNHDPMLVVEITLQRVREIWLRATGEGEEFLEASSLAPESSCLFQIPIEVIGVPASCIQYLAHVISGFNLDASLCSNLAFQIASYAYSLIGHCRGFHVSSHVDLVDIYVRHVAPGEIMPILDSEGVAVRRGASKTVLNKLKKESFYMKQGQGHGDSSSGSSCVVCLEDFSSSVKLTKLPCSHVFHENCIFRWLENSKSCPLCRTEVE